MKTNVDLTKYNPTVSRTGERVNLIRVICKCGHVLTFLSKHPVSCRHCGELVYPTKKLEFRNKLMKEMRKHEQSNS